MKKRYSTIMVLTIAQNAKSKAEANKEVRRIIAEMRPVIPASTIIKAHYVNTEKLLF